MKQLIALLFPALLFLAGCAPSQTPEAMAGDLCRCMQPMAESMTVIKELSAGGEIDRLEKAMTQLDEVAAEVDECMNGLEDQYGEALTTEEKAIREAMMEQCPEVVAAMEEASALF